MAGSTITIDVKDQGVRDMLGAIGARLGHLRPAMTLIGEIVTESIQRNFLQHRSPEGAPWKPLSPAYAAWKSGDKGRSPNDILVLNRILMGSIHPKVGRDQVAIGTNIVYAAIHHFGGRTRAHEIKPVTGQALHWKGAKHPVKSVHHPGSIIPARPYVGVRNEDWAEIKAALTTYLLSTT